MPVSAISELYKPIKDVMTAATGVNRILLSGQGEPVITGTYGTYNPILVRAYGAPRHEQTDVAAIAPIPSFEWQDMAWDTITAVELMVSVNFLGPDSRDVIWQLQRANYRLPVQEMLRQYGMAWRYTSDVRDLTAIEQADVQLRYQCDVNLFVETMHRDIIYRAASVETQVFDEYGNQLSGA